MFSFIKRHIQEQVVMTLTRLARTNINVFKTHVYLLENDNSPYFESVTFKKKFKTVEEVKLLRGF